uniref:Reverse transcriptase domain-containing protein n=1 Tax=Megaselia scalaris TaxID=36166 RepID=T1GIA1_MEGSC
MIVNEILLKCESHPVQIVAYAGNVAIIISGLFAQVACENMNKELRMLKDWTVSCELSINSTMTELHTPSNLILPKLDEVSINLSSKAKYLGLILDSKLKWIRMHNWGLRKVRTLYMPADSK